MIVLATIVVGASYTILDSNRKTTMSDMHEKIVESFYVATMELINGTHENKDKPMYHKIVTVTWSFFV